ncbi:MAG: LysM peptidoglycan-binding domain-containing protein [Pleurocapsa minor GSE-CHR-MK-17-07R]|jgi:LysM repeat protein|nr:LysM peptidoglycan-binding domain-containing protein [Pleurocapsa minor GSE-CHR-MK 17-07R]
MRHKAHFLFLLLFSIALAVFVPSAAAQTVTLALTPGSTTVNVGDTFNISVQLSTGTLPVDGAEVNLAFDPAVLQVNSVTASTFTINLIGPSFSNGAGTITYTGGSLSGFPSGTFNILNISFSAIAASAGTSVSVGGGTQVTSGGSFVLSGSSGASVVVNNPVAPTDTPIPPTNTPIPPTNTPVVPTDTPDVPTNTPVVPTNTPSGPTLTPSNTPIPPTQTPSITPGGPTLTPSNTPIIPPTNTPLPPAPTNTPVGPPPTGVPPTTVPAGGSQTPPPGTAIPCPFVNSGSTTLVQISVPAGAVPNGNVYCSILTTAAEIGVTTGNVLNAVEVFALSTVNGSSITRFSAPIRVCVQGVGSIIYRDANFAPRITQSYPAQPSGGYTCTSIPNAGTVIVLGTGATNPTPPPGGGNASGTIYIVRTGDTLYRIALRFGVSLNAIAAANNIVNPSRIFVGQSLVIPLPGSVLPQPGGQPPAPTSVPLPTTVPQATGQPGTPNPGVVGISHRVSAGETLFRIALRYGVPLRDVALANGIANPSLIYPGQVLLIPTGGVPPASGGTTQRTHVVRYGDTLFRIAQLYNASLTGIAAANNIVNINLISIGQVLIIPG